MRKMNLKARIMKIKSMYNEEWKLYRREKDNWKDSQKYLVSNYGRVQSIKTKIPVLLKLGFTSGFPVVSGIRCKDEKSRSFYVHHAVTELFIGPKPDDESRIIHIDFNKENNVYSNLKWANKEEWWEQHSKNPKVIAARKKRTYAKLNEAKVAIIKRTLFDPNRKTRLKMIAKHYGVSEMQLHRIKTGENWGSVKPAK